MNVSAGIKVLLGPTPLLRSVVAVLGMRASLPGGLIARLEALRSQLEDPSSSTKAVKAPPQSVSAGPSGSASSGSALPAPPLKRGASQSSLSVPGKRIAKRAKGPAS